jgi:septal ring-binding cell division protein DamX
VAHQLQDEGFHEIQLNGKQLVFLFMAATVVSVVIFLCGVLVGRGVRAERSVVDSTPAGVVDTTPQPAPATPPQQPPGSDPTTAAAPPPAADDLSYFKRLEKPNAQPEQLKPAPAGRAAAAQEKEKEKAAPPAPQPQSRPEPARATAATAAAEAAEPGGQGFAVQIAALNVRSEADAIAKRLSSKGYAAYVISPANGTPAVYRVRVGKFPTRREAETVAARLQKEEQFKPWVTR